MDTANTEDTRSASQAWRKRPRKFAPKSRLGCKTCKIRRVKCDLARPSCSKCSSTGRKCDGYDGIIMHSSGTKNTESGLDDEYYVSASASVRCWGQTQNGMIEPTRLEEWRTLSLKIPCEAPRPFMILPGSESGAEAMCFFEQVSIRHLNEHHPSRSWRESLMRFSQTVPSVRHAATALALIHRDYLHDRNDRMYQLRSLRDRLTEEGPLIHYNRAIQALLRQQQSTSRESTAITLLVCYLLICFDHLAGNDMQAMTHLRGGVQLSRSIGQGMMGAEEVRPDATFSGIDTLVHHVSRQIRRLDMQAVMFLVDWTPAFIYEAYSSQSIPVDGAFESIGKAADHLQALVARVMSFYWELQASPDGVPASLLSDKEFVLWQLEAWSDLVESTVESLFESDSEADSSVPVMRLQQKIAWTLLSSLGAGREMDYDDYLSHFQQCIVMAAGVLMTHEKFSGPSTPSFTPEIGIVPILYLIGVKCRDPSVRRDALALLQRQPIREAVWDSITAARVVNRVIEIEETGLGGDSTPPSMQEIASWRRVEALSWVHDVEQEGVVKLDITYTLCGQEGMRLESLVF